MGKTDTDQQSSKTSLPIQVELYINADGSVTFADLEEKTLPIAHRLDPDRPLPGDQPDRSAAAPGQTGSADG